MINSLMKKEIGFYIWSFPRACVELQESYTKIVRPILAIH